MYRYYSWNFVVKSVWLAAFSSSWVTFSTITSNIPVGCYLRCYKTVICVSTVCGKSFKTHCFSHKNRIWCSLAQESPGKQCWSAYMKLFLVFFCICMKLSLCTNGTTLQFDVLLWQSCVLHAQHMLLVSVVFVIEAWLLFKSQLYAGVDSRLEASRFRPIPWLKTPRPRLDKQCTSKLIQITWLCIWLCI